MPPAKVQIQVIHTEQMIPVFMNPEEFTISHDNSFATQSIPGLSGPVVQFVAGNQRTLEMELLFDTWDTPQAQKRDVRVDLRRVTCLMDIDPDLHAPPLLKVTWASLEFRCVLSRATQRFIMFTPEGVPVRARLNVTFSEVLDLQQEGKRCKRETADLSKLYTVGDGDTLSAIAARLYDDPLLWRAIAVQNEIADPRAIVTGQKLLVPSLPYRDPQTGEVIG
ncbi:MAG TPA: LysM peptidoglycan-binding domain-containing protein [Anaerolineae bacterium]|nr:LysM peptidoglycan-binding domain-containing protein [Anaerolineae bacterium]